MRNLVLAAVVLAALTLVLAGCGGGGTSGGSSSGGSSSGGSSSSGGPGSGPATLTVNSTPSGAQIRLDGEEKGITPATFEISGSDLTTEHTVSLTLAGYNAWSGLATLTNGNTFALQANLAAASAPAGTLVARSEPTGARIWLDGADTGRVTPATLANVPASQHLVEYRRTGTYTFRETVQIPPGATAISAPVLTALGNGRVAGRVLDPEGNGLVDAQVTVNGTSAVARTTTYGIFLLPNVPAGTRTLAAAINAGGVSLSGARTYVRVESGRLTANADIITSINGSSGTLYGRVTNTRSQAVPGAVVFASLATAPNFLPDPETAPRQAETDAAGNFELQRVPPGFWVLTAVYPDMATVTRGITSQIYVAADAEVDVNFQLPEASSGTPDRPLDLSAVAFTMPTGASRAADAYEGTKDRLLAVSRTGQWGARAARLENVRRRSVTRTAPPGSLIEVDLSWALPSAQDVVGYYIGRSEQQGTGFALIEDLLNPHAGLWIDYDARLSPGRSYFYRVTTTTSRDERSDPSATATARPLGQMTSVSPAGTIDTNRPTFTWEALDDASVYGVQLFGQFPDRAVDPVWESDLVHSPSTSVMYSGPALQSGHTYYWLVIGGNDTDTQRANGWSLSRITSFTVR